jgi:protein-disulfide isomerase
MTTLPRRAPRDVRALLSSPLALVLALLYIAGAGSVIAYFPGEPPASQHAAPLTPLTDQQRADLAKWWEVQPKVDIPIPNDGAKVSIVVFSDYQCPHCRAAHETYRSVIDKYTSTGQAHFVLKHFPLEGECNTYAPNGSHTAACEAAAAVVLARATGKAAAMDDWLFTNQATLTPSVVREAARDVGGIADFNGGYAQALQEVRADASLGGLLGVNSTPTFFINGHKVPPGVIPPEYFDALIDLELKRTK